MYFSAKKNSALNKQRKRGNKTMENIKVNKSDCKMGTMSVRELMEIPNVIKTDTTHNPTDGVLPIQR